MPATDRSGLQTLIDQTIVAAKAADLSKLERDSLLSGLARLREGSIGREGRRLADALLAGRTYGNPTFGPYRDAGRVGAFSGLPDGNRANRSPTAKWA